MNNLENKGKNMKYNKKLYLLENELSYSKEERGAFLESLQKFGQFKNEIYRSKTLREISQQLGELIESAEGFTLQETQDNFDKISVSRDLKEIKNDYNMFAKTCNEITTLQQRLEAVYENIGQKLGRYYDI